MSHTNIGETNTKLYRKNTKSLSKDEFNEIYYATGSGGFYSTIYDMVTFAKNMPGLFNDSNLIKLLDLCDMNETGIMLSHHGLAIGGASMFSVQYNLKFKFIDCAIAFDTLAI
jgi:hypothetical protein